PERGIIRKHDARVGGVVGRSRRAHAARTRGPGTRSTDDAPFKPVITPRITRLLRVAELQAMHAYLVRCAAGADARRCAIIVPSRVAAEAVRQTLENRCLTPESPALLLPDIVTRGEFYDRLHSSLPNPPAKLTDFERDV